jgi:hypothetical protein
MYQFFTHTDAPTNGKNHHATAISYLWVDFIIKIPASDRAAVGPTNFYTVLKKLLTIIPTPTPMPWGDGIPSPRSSSST